MFLNEKPSWCDLIPPNVLNNNQFKKLESLRKDNNIDEKNFAMGIVGSPEFTLKVQKISYQNLKKLCLSDKEIFKKILLDRYFERAEKEINQAAESVSSFDDLCKYILKEDEKLNPDYEPTIVSKKIDEIIKD